MKAIYELGEGGDRVATNVLSEHLAVAGPSVTAMIKRLSESKPPLVEYESHRGVRLTRAGRQVALASIRRHRLLEAFLCGVLGYTWDEVHREAERLEYHVSPMLADRIAAYLGEPAVDPHGDPIPTRDGRIAEVESVPLSRVELGRRARVLRVTDEQGDLLRYLSSIGIEPDAVVEVTRRDPFGGPLYVRVTNREPGDVQGVGERVAEAVLVRVVEDA